MSNFYNDHVKGTYFECTPNQLLTLLSIGMKYNKERLYCIETEEGKYFTLDSDVISPDNTLKGKEGSMWVLENLWKKELEEETPKKPAFTLFNGAMIKIENGKVFKILSLKGDLFAYDPYKDTAYELTPAFIDKVVEVRNGSGVYPIPTCSDFEKYGVVWKKEAEKKTKVFVGISYQASPELKNCIASCMGETAEMVEWNSNASEATNIKTISKCDKLVLIAPNNFHQSRIIGKGLYTELTAFLQNHSMDKVRVAYLNSEGTLNLDEISGYSKFTPEDDYVNYATLKLKYSN